MDEFKLHQAVEEIYLKESFFRRTEKSLWHREKRGGKNE